MKEKFWSRPLDTLELRELQDGLSHMLQLQTMTQQLIQDLHESIRRKMDGEDLDTDDLQHLDLLVGEIKFHIHDTLHDLRDVERREKDHRMNRMR